MNEPPTHYLCTKTSSRWQTRKGLVYVIEDDEMVHYSTRTAPDIEKRVELDRTVDRVRDDEVPNSFFLVLRVERLVVDS